MVAYSRYRSSCLLLLATVVIMYSNYQEISSEELIISASNILKQSSSLLEIQPVGDEKEESKKIKAPGADQDQTLKFDLPIAGDRGVLVVFIHIPKSGGSSLNSLLKDAVDHYHNGWTNRNAQHGLRSVDNALRDWKNESHCFELHGAGAPSFHALATKFMEWKKTCRHLGIPFFAFTVLREPQSFALSYFNFFHGGHHRKYTYYASANQNTFLRHTLSNPQCLFLARSDKQYLPQYQNDSQTFTWKECLQAYGDLTALMDWVGITSTLSNETIPILSTVLNKTLDVGYRENQSHKRNFVVSQLDDAGKRVIANRTLFDRRIYERAQSEFRFSRWRNVEMPAVPATSVET